MRAIDLSGLPYFSLDNCAAAPKCSGIYYVINSIEIIEYVGQSWNIRQRWRNHQCSKKLEEKKGVKVVWVKINRASVGWIEKRMIGHFRPRLNCRVYAKEEEKMYVDELNNLVICYPCSREEAEKLVRRYAMGIAEFISQVGIAKARLQYSADANPIDILATLAEVKMR